jgi:hypothetical protein
MLSALAAAAVAPTEKIGPRHFYEPNAVLFFFPFIAVDLRALLRVRFCNIDVRGRSRTGSVVKASRAGSHRQVCDHELDAGDVDCGGGDSRFCSSSDAPNPADPERYPEFLGMAGGRSL